MDELRYERVEGDLFDITERIREIDESYFILRERKSGRLEVHSRAQKGSTLALVLPRKRLDCRDLEYVRRTRSERKRALLEEMRLENERLMREETARAVRQAELAAEHALSN